MTGVLRCCLTSVVSILICVSYGCASYPTNPSFPIDVKQAREAIEAMESDPKELTRPVVILNGWAEPGITAGYLKSALGRVFGTEKILAISFLFDGTFGRCRQKVIEAVDKAFPCSDPVWTTEVDVVAVSMGALVARHAAAEEQGKRRLRMVRLFTLGAPHRGAKAAGIPTFDRLLIDTRPGSAFLARLNAALPSSRYTVVPYVRLGDSLVGPSNAAPEGVTPWWVPTPPFELAHIQMGGDPRIIADILRHLRGEEPLTREPPAPLPAADACSRR